MSEIFTKARLGAVMPYCKDRIDQWIAPLNAAALEFEFDAPLRASMFIAQAAHETGEFKYLQEIASGEAYEGRKDLGNTQPGDGVLTKGRGIFQLTGVANYKAAGRDLFLDEDWFLFSPHLAEEPVNAARIAGWYWRTHKLSAMADAGDLKSCTKTINGGYNGWTSRQMYYTRATAVFL